MVDQDLVVEFEFISKQALPVLRLAVTTTEGLELISSNIRERYEDIPVRQVIKRKVIVVPSTEDKFYLDLYVVTEIEEDKRAKHIRIPIAVGSYSLNNDPPAVN